MPLRPGEPGSPTLVAPLVPAEVRSRFQAMSPDCFASSFSVLLQEALSGLLGDYVFSAAGFGGFGVCC